MTGVTHILGGIAAGIAVSALAGMDGVSAVGFTCASIAGSLFPDIDLCTSKAGSKAKPVSFLISHTFGHRTLFHSPLLYTTIYPLCNHYMPYLHPWILAFTVGAASHLLLDMFNYKGIPLLYPLSKHYHIASIKTGGKGEAAFGVVLAGAVFLMIAARISGVPFPASQI